jgi:hypothetical protein
VKLDRPAVNKGHGRSATVNGHAVDRDLAVLGSIAERA